MGPGPAVGLILSPVRSDRWPGPPPQISVVISTFRRPEFLAGLVAALENQDLAVDAWEVIVLDNGSGDGTWRSLVATTATTRLRMTAMKIEDNRGPGGGRNTASREARSGIVAFTDDDCLPTPTWLTNLLAGFAGGVDLVQGRVRPEPDEWMAAGPWDHSVDVGRLTPWAETSNVAYRRSAFESVGRFDEGDPLTGRRGGGRAFGEDALLAWRVLQLGGERRFAADALVYHRVVPRRWRTVVGDWRECRGFPGLARASGLVSDSLRWNLFLSRDTAAFDLAAVSVLVAVLTRRPGVLLGLLPWLRRRWPAARRSGPTFAASAKILGQRAALEAVALGSLIEGSVRHRRLVL